MRTFLLLPAVLLALLAATQALPAQTASAKPAPTWDRILALKPGTTLHLNLKSAHKRCNVQKVDADSLTCTHGSTPDVYQKADILQIKQSHRGRSTLAMAGIGAGVGFAAGFAAGTNNNPNAFFGPNFLRGAAAAIFAAFGAIIGAPIGYFTDFTSGSPLYKAP